MYPLADMWVVSGLGLFHIKLLRVFTYECRMLSFLFGKYLGVEWLDPMVSMCFIFKEMTKLFSQVTISLHIPASSVGVQVPPRLRGTGGL